MHKPAPFLAHRIPQAPPEVARWENPTWGMPPRLVRLCSVLLALLLSALLLLCCSCARRPTATAELHRERAAPSSTVLAEK